MNEAFCFGWEIPFIEKLQFFQNPVLDKVATFVTLFSEPGFLVLIIGLFYWCIDKKLGRRIALCLSGGMMFGTLIKGLVLRKRPYMDYRHVKCIRAAYPDEDIYSCAVQGYSFPSIHATMSLSIYGTIAKNIKNKILIIICLIIPLLVGLSRPYLGVHYPTDVLCGWLLGAIVIFLFSYIEEKLGYKTGYLIVIFFGALGMIYCRNEEYFTFYGVAIGCLLGFMFEEYFVKFQTATKKWEYFVRPIGGILVFLAVDLLLKAFVKNVDLDGTNMLMLFYRLFRYTMATFVTLGVYPLVFKLGNKGDSKNE